MRCGRASARDCHCWLRRPARCRHGFRQPELRGGRDSHEHREDLDEWRSPLGYSGQVALREPLRKAIDKHFSATPPPSHCPIEIAASSLCATIRPVLEHAYTNFVGGPGDDPTEKLAGSLMVIGLDGEKYWLLELDRHNTPSHYTDDGFHTIGTGSVAAHVGRGLLKHYSLPGYEVAHLRLLAYRTVATCIDVLGGAYGLGHPVQLWQSAGDGFKKVTGMEFSAVGEGVRQWIAIEQESLDRVFAEAEGAEAQEAEPLPERLDEV